MQLRTPQGASIADVFTFLSGLYFRGKIAYARRFANPPANVPGQLVITSGGQDFRPIDVIPLSTGFGQQRLRQRETQSAVYVYSGDIDVDHPLTVSFQGQQSVLWEQVLQRIERERALVKARATRGN